MIRAPSARATWIVAVPTPPAPASTSTVVPGRTHAHEHLLASFRLGDFSDLERPVDAGENGGLHLAQRRSLCVDRELLAQRELAELADARLRNLVDELEAVRQPELRELRRE